MDRTILVTEPTISSVSGAKRWLSVFSDLDYSRERHRHRFSITRARISNRWSKRQQKALGLKRTWYLPSSYNALEQSCLEGTPRWYHIAKTLMSNR
ncbi:MAG: hypothetical protein R3D26_24770 [Cyanobacteriota/Melainabacteria group bacterium]